MTKDNQMIMAVERDDLFHGNEFQGFKPFHGAPPFLSRISKNYSWMRRGRGGIENDPDFKQPIPYGTIVNKDSGKVFAYKRAVSEPGKYDEPRLAGNWSIGIGGHVNPADYADKISARGRAADILYNAMLRESQEEVKLGRVWDRAWFRKPFTSFSLAGYINIDDQSMVNRVHFGVSYLIDTNATRAKPKDPEIEIGGFKSLDELEELYNLSQDPASGVSLEPWSKIVFPFVKQSF